MNIKEIAAIALQRLSKWRGMMVNKMQTPVLVISIGHGEKNRGEIGVYTVENISDADLIQFLQGAINALSHDKTGEVEGPAA